MLPLAHWFGSVREASRALPLGRWSFVPNHLQILVSVQPLDVLTECRNLPNSADDSLRSNRLAKGFIQELSL
jgi:hypothetical protein